MLNFNPAWRFDSPGPMPPAATNAFAALIIRLAQGRQSLLEHFKVYFAGAAGRVSNTSSSASWAQSDLGSDMADAAENAPLFIEAFWEACEALADRDPPIPTPGQDYINRLLNEHSVGFQIQPPNLISDLDFGRVDIATTPASLDEQAQGLIHTSLHQAERLLQEGRGRLAVQESLWLLETVSTAFQGLSVADTTIQGKYFNKIAEELRRNSPGTTLNQVLGWVGALHGYLSSPTGGGVRHGADLKAGLEVRDQDARLYCNLIRSYIAFLLAEYDRIQRQAAP
jgi:hypothetical protein